MTGSARRHSALAVALLTLAVWATSTLATAPSVLAHAEVVSTNPIDGELLDALPAEVSLEFGEDLLDVGDALVVTAPDGTVISDATPNVHRRTISSGLAGPGTAGEYAVAYRVVSQDGHTVKGRFTFSVGEPPADATMPTTPDGTASALPVTLASTTPADTSEPTIAAAPAASNEPQQEQGQVADSSPMAIVIGAVLIVILIAVALALVRRRR